jgi:ATP-binding cassette subfamily B protein
LHEPDADEVLGRAFDRHLAARIWDATRPHRGLILGTAAMFPLVSAVELVQPYLIKVAIDDHILRGDWVGLTPIALAFLGTLAVLYVLRAVHGYLLGVTGQRVMHDLRHAIFEHLQRMDAPFFDRNPVGRLMTRVLHDVEAVSEMFTSGVVAILADVLTLAGVVVIMLGLEWRLALVIFSVIPVLFGVGAYFRTRARAAYRTVRTCLARVNAFLQESIQGMAVVQLCARERAELRRFTGLSRDYRRALFQSTRADATLYAAVEAIGSASVALLIWYGGGRILVGALTFGSLVAFIEYTTRFFLPIRDLGAKYAVMQAAMASAERIFGLLDAVPRVPSPIEPGTAVPAARAVTAAPVVLEGVWFGYRPGEWVLRDCSLTVAAGERVAVVGATGAGKTTIARLLNRSYDVDRGRVLVEGVDVRDWDLRALRRRVGIVQQDAVLFTGSLEDNLRLGVDGEVSRADLDRAVAAANAQFIAALPRGYAHELSERGANLSHGQRQLLAIARALVYNPALLVLDEATSSVDPESELLIQEAMTRLLAGRTSLVIAHRLSTIQNADRILVVHRGRVEEEGRHAELLRLRGLYARLHELQFSPGPA